MANLNSVEAADVRKNLSFNMDHFCWHGKKINVENGKIRLTLNNGATRRRYHVAILTATADYHDQDASIQNVVRASFKAKLKDQSSVDRAIPVKTESSCFKDSCKKFINHVNMMVGREAWLYGNPINTTAMARDFVNKTLNEDLVDMVKNQIDTQIEVNHRI